MRDVAEEIEAFDRFERLCIFERMFDAHERRKLSLERGERVEPHFLVTERVLSLVRTELNPLFRMIQSGSTLIAGCVDLDTGK